MSCVLIVEDDADVRGFMDLLLSTSGYRTMCAGNGEEALRKMQECEPCIVLLDLQMPVMDGWTFRARQLSDPLRARIPVVCITAHYDPDEISRTLGVRCLRKPVEFGDILQEVRHACGGVARA